MEEDFEPQDRQQEMRGAFHWRRALVIALAALVLAWLILKLPDFSAKAELGTAYAAHAGCACHFIEGRDIESCQTDLEGAAWMVSMEVDEGTRSVTGSVPLFGSRTASYRKDWGCLLEPME